MDLKSVEKAAQKIQATLFKNSNSISIGMLKSHFRGSGLQFKEHQIYSHGDDVRFIDWKLLAKTNHPYVKTFEEERNVEITVVLDASMSMLVGHKGVSKLQAAIELTCLLFILAKHTKDTVQVILIADEIKVLPKKSGHEGIIYLIALLEEKQILTKEGRVNVFYRPSNRTTPEQRVKAITQNVIKRKEVLIFSDFHDFIPFAEIKRIIYKANLHCFQMIAPIDENTELPYAVFGFDSNKGSGKGDFLKIKSDKKISELEEILGKKFKKLKVESRYLEDFVREMM